MTVLIYVDTSEQLRPRRRGLLKTMQRAWLLSTRFWTVRP